MMFLPKQTPPVNRSAVESPVLAKSTGIRPSADIERDKTIVWKCVDDIDIPVDPKDPNPVAFFQERVCKYQIPGVTTGWVLVE